MICTQIVRDIVECGNMIFASVQVILPFGAVADNE